jgi:hypothetical protein
MQTTAESAIQLALIQLVCNFGRGFGANAFMD